MSNSNFPGVDAMQDSLEFIKKMWTGLGVPGMVVPTLKIEEINKQITDLKAVESWLNLNLNMLHTTIQALEVQSATLSALHALATVNQAGVDAQKEGAADAAATTWPIPGFPFAFMNPTQNTNVPLAPGQAAKEEVTQEQATSSPAENMASNTSMGASGAWWDLLQNQFKQAVNSVVAAEKAARTATTNTVAKNDVNVAAKPQSKASSKAAQKKNDSVDGGKAVSRSSKTKNVLK